jgi:hypothetical protein
MITPCATGGWSGYKISAMGYYQQRNLLIMLFFRIFRVFKPIIQNIKSLFFNIFLYSL